MMIEAVRVHYLARLHALYEVTHITANLNNGHLLCKLWVDLSNIFDDSCLAIKVIYLCILPIALALHVGQSGNDKSFKTDYTSSSVDNILTTLGLDF